MDELVKEAEMVVKPSSEGDLSKMGPIVERMIEDHGEDWRGWFYDGLLKMRREEPFKETLESWSQAASLASKTEAETLYGMVIGEMVYKFDTSDDPTSFFFARTEGAGNLVELHRFMKSRLPDESDLMTDIFFILEDCIPRKETVEMVDSCFHTLAGTMSATTLADQDIRDMLELCDRYLDLSGSALDRWGDKSKDLKYMDAFAWLFDKLSGIILKKIERKSDEELDEAAESWRHDNRERLHKPFAEACGCMLAYLDSDSKSERDELLKKAGKLAEKYVDTYFSG